MVTPLLQWIRMAHCKVLSTNYCSYSHQPWFPATNSNSYTPSLVQPFISNQLAVAGLLAAIENEAAVLGVLSVNKATYGIYAHTILAQKAGYTLEQVEAMLAGTCPADITARQAAIYNLAVKLAQMRGPLDAESFNAALSVLGRDGVASAIQQSAAFMYAAVMLNAGDVCLPPGVDSD
jgi:4-carboxymuconolactone decarboxylase